MKGYIGFNQWNKWSVILANLITAGSLENPEVVKQNSQVFSVLVLSQVGLNHMGD